MSSCVTSMFSSCAWRNGPCTTTYRNCTNRATKKLITLNAFGIKTLLQHHYKVISRQFFMDFTHDTIAPFDTIDENLFAKEMQIP